MMEMSPWHWLIVVIVFAAVAWPASRILKKAGFSPWWALLAPISPLNIIGMWVLAYVRWPAERDRL